MKIDKVLMGKAIARFRQERGLTQSQLNSLIGMSTVQHIEQGRNAVSLACLDKIASALKIPAACIVLLGSKVDKGDRVLSSLRSLLETTMSLEVDEKPTIKGVKGKKTVRAGKPGVRKIAIQRSASPLQFENTTDPT